MKVPTLQQSKINGYLMGILAHSHTDVYAHFFLLLYLINDNHHISLKIYCLLVCSAFGYYKAGVLKYTVCTKKKILYGNIGYVLC